MVGLAACGDSQPTPTPTVAPPAPTPTVTPVVSAIATPLPTAVLTAATDVAMSATPHLQVTPTISVPQVETAGGCTVDYELDLAGYPDLKAQMGCALSQATTNPVAINEFGKGPDYNRFMLWFSDTRQIYVLLADHSWQAYNDTWQEGQPEFSCNPLTVAPKSPPLPRRGFGKLWCAVDGLQQKLGTIDREERLCQHTVVQRFEKGQLLACFEDATIRYFRLLNDGTWDLMMVQ